eukprot:TRINITY_DN5017_c0_g1_i9.p1 TRINITY_DN5017_c0_g1~~TRINITY_DN5017_c0_g1_i9.p1  ORF type:complete len:198 (-),score=32.50 TRINITY_DN5017_c0_g1_i9:889-1482(-)
MLHESDVKDLNEQEIDNFISNHFRRKDFPILVEDDLENIINYFKDKDEHYFLKYINLRKIYSYNPKTKYDHYNNFPFEKDGSGKLLKKILFFSERSLTTSFSSRYARLESDLSGRKISFANCEKLYFPCPNRLYYCASPNHPIEDKRFKKSALFYFFDLPFCNICNRTINISNYIVKFDLREQIEIKLSTWIQSLMT